MSTEHDPWGLPALGHRRVLSLVSVPVRRCGSDHFHRLPDTSQA